LIEFTLEKNIIYNITMWTNVENRVPPND